MVTIAQLIINIPDAVVSRVTEALCDGKNVSVANAKQKVITFIKATTRTYETQKAGQQAQATAAASVDSDVILS